MHLEDSAFGSFSVNDIPAALKFYQETLGLDVEQNKMPTGEELLELKFKNGTEFIIYPKKDHRPATHTVLNFGVGDLEATVKELKEKGVRFEHYEGNDANEIRHDGNHEVAWFKDPAGNFLSVMKQ